jgi:hypothetical protein
MGFIMVKAKSFSLKLFIGKILGEKRRRKLLKKFWFSLAYHYIINGPNEIKMVEPRIKCKVIPITLENYHRVNDFREEERILEYRNKLYNNEIGCFAEHDGKMVGSIWATINNTNMPFVGKDFTKIMPNEGLLHDDVVSEKIRGMGVGGFLESRMLVLLFNKYGLNKITTDINVSNRASVRMTEKVGLRIDHKVLYVAAFGKMILKLVLKRYS